jgi:hypothetical protein
MSVSKAARCSLRLYSIEFESRYRGRRTKYLRRGNKFLVPSSASLPSGVVFSCNARVVDQDTDTLLASLDLPRKLPGAMTSIRNFV